MAYTPKTWVAGSTSLAAADFNHMEQGIYALDQQVTNLIGGSGSSSDATISSLNSRLTTAEGNITSLSTQLNDSVVLKTVTLNASGWSNKTLSVTVSGVKADETKQVIQPIPAAASKAEYISSGVTATAQAANSLTFTCKKQPTSNLTVYVIITEV